MNHGDFEAINDAMMYNFQLFNKYLSEADRRKEKERLLERYHEMFFLKRIKKYILFYTYIWLSIICLIIILSLCF